MFHISRIGTIAGCSVLSERSPGREHPLLRTALWCTKEALLLKRFKDDVKEVAEGTSATGIDGYNDSMWRQIERS